MPAERTNSCPGDEVFGAFIGGALAAAERAELEEHVDACPACAELLAQIARSPLVSIDSGASTGGVAPALPRRLLPGEELGRYVVVEELGAGGMGVVYVAQDPKLKRRLAVKLLRPRLADGAAGQERLLAEARTLASLSHRNVVQVFDVGTHGDQVYIAMELINGANLRQWRAKANSTWSEALRVCLEAGRGLAAVHAAGINHRDVKPSNVLVANDGRVVLIDFGLSGAHSRTPSRDIAGTPGYIAPEQLDGSPPDPRADQFAFCVLVHETVHGARPFDESGAANEVDLSGAPAWLAPVLDRGLASDPRERYPSVEALLVALAGPPRRTRRIFPVVAGLVVAGIGFAWWSADAPCEAAGDRIDSMWNDRRPVVAAAFNSTELSFADATWRRASGDLDAWATRWSGEYAAVCERGGPELDAQMACLERARRHVGGLIEVLAEADRGVVVAASAMDASLPDVAACRSADAVPDPQAEATYAMIATAEAELAAGRFDAALERAQAAYDAAQDDEALRAAAALSVGRAAAKTGELELSGDYLATAASAAEASGDDNTYVRALVELAWLDGYERLKLDEARQHVRHAEAGLARLADATELHADLEYRRGWIEFKEGDPQRAREHFEAALEGHADPMEKAADKSAIGGCSLRLGELEAAARDLEASRELAEVSLGPTHPDLIPILNNIGAAQRLTGKLGQAEATYRRLVEMASEAHGEQHVLVGRLRLNLGTVLGDRGRIDASLAEFERAGAVLQAAVGPDHPEIARALDGQAEALHQKGELAAAIRLYERGLAIKQEALGVDHPSTAINLTNIGLLRYRDDRPAEALAPLQRAATLIDNAYGEADQLVTALTGLANVLAELDRSDEAAATYDRAIAIGKKLGSADLGQAMQGRGELYLDAGNAKAALPLLEAAIRHWQGQEGIDPVFEGYARFDLARARWALGDRDAARMQARTALQQVAGVDPNHHATIVAWLREH